MVLLSSQTTDRGSLSIVIERERRQVLVSHRAAQVATVSADDIGGVVRSDPDRLMARGVPIREQARHCTITEQIRVSVEFEPLVPQHDVVEVDRSAGHEQFVGQGRPLPGLDDHGRVRKLAQPPGMIEVQVSQNRMGDLAGFEPRSRQHRSQRV